VTVTNEVVQIRGAHPDEAPTIVSVLRQSFAEFEFLYTPEAFAATVISEEQARERMRSGLTWVALLGNTIIGTVSVFEKDDDIVYIRGMAVLPSVRGQNVGRRLLDKIESFAVEKGRTRLQLRTAPCLTAAIRLYERFGFLPDHRSMDLFGTRLIGMTKELTSENQSSRNLMVSMGRNTHVTD
jgi:putative acetyltransferase